MKYKAVVADVDGTLIPPSEKPAPFPSLLLREKVEEVQKRGITFTLASGRSFSWVKNLIAGLKIQAPVILDNGARIYDPVKKTFIWESLLDFSQAKKVLSILTQEKNLSIFIDEGKKNISTFLEIKKRKIAKILILGITSKKAIELQAKLKPLLKIYVARTISGLGKKNESLHITDKKATKKMALFQWSKITKISPQEIIGIGDSFNDLPFLSVCGLKVAMENAIPDLKEIADYIAPSYEKEGVAYVLEKFLLKK